MVVTRDFREEDRDIMNGYKVAVWEHEKVLGVDSGDGCTTLNVFTAAEL